MFKRLTIAFAALACLLAGTASAVIQSPMQSGAAQTSFACPDQSFMPLVPSVSSADSSFYFNELTCRNNPMEGFDVYGLKICVVVGYKKVTTKKSVRWVPSKSRVYDPETKAWGAVEDMQADIPELSQTVSVSVQDVDVGGTDWARFSGTFSEINKTELGGDIIARLAPENAPVVCILLNGTSAKGNFTRTLSAHIDDPTLRGLADELGHLEYNAFVRSEPYQDAGGYPKVRFKGQSVLHVDGLNEKQQVLRMGQAGYADVGEAHAVRVQNVIAAQWETQLNKELQKRGRPAIRPSEPWSKYPQSKGGGGLILNYLPIVPEGWEQQRRSDAELEFPRRYYPESVRQHYLK